MRQVGTCQIPKETEQHCVPQHKQPSIVTQQNKCGKIIDKTQDPMARNFPDIYNNQGISCIV